MTQEQLYWLSTMAIGLGVGVLAHWLLSGVVSALIGLTGRRRRVLAVFAKSEEKVVSQVVVGLDDLTGINKIPWPTVYFLVSLAVFVVYLRMQNPLVWLLAFSPLGMRAWLFGLRKRRLTTETWHFLMDLRVRLTLRGTLLLALQDVARASESPIARAVKVYLEAGFQGSGLDLLARLSQDTHLPFLDDLVARTRAAQAGMLSLDKALRQAMSRIQAEMETVVRENLQRVPSKVILLAFPMLLGPGLVVLMYPLVARILSSLQGLSWGGGF